MLKQTLVLRKNSEHHSRSFVTKKTCETGKLLNPSPSQALLMDFIKFIVFLLTVELLNLTNKASENDDHSFQTWFVQITSNSYVQLARHVSCWTAGTDPLYFNMSCLHSFDTTGFDLITALFRWFPSSAQISWSWTWSIKACWVDDACKHLLHQWKLALCVLESTSTVHQLTCTLKWPALFTHNHCLLILGIFWNHCRDLHWRYFSQSTTALVCSCYVYMRPSKRQKSSSNGDITSVSPGWKAAGLPARLPPGEGLNGWPTSGRFWKKLKLHNNPNSNFRIFRLANTKNDDSSRSLLPVCFKQISLDRWTRAPFFEYQPFSSVPPIWRAASLFGSQQDAWSSNQVVVPTLETQALHSHNSCLDSGVSTGTIALLAVPVVGVWPHHFEAKELTLELEPPKTSKTSLLPLPWAWSQGSKHDHNITTFSQRIIGITITFPSHAQVLKKGRSLCLR